MPEKHPFWIEGDVRNKDGIDVGVAATSGYGWGTDALEAVAALYNVEARCIKTGQVLHLITENDRIDNVTHDTDSQEVLIEGTTLNRTEETMYLTAVGPRSPMWDQDPDSSSTQPDLDQWVKDNNGRKPGF